jgi:hypothetical protein
MRFAGAKLRSGAVEVNRGAVAKLREADPADRPAKPEPEKPPKLCPMDPLA